MVVVIVVVIVVIIAIIVVINVTISMCAHLPVTFESGRPYKAKMHLRRFLSEVDQCKKKMHVYLIQNIADKDNICHLIFEDC